MASPPLTSSTPSPLGPPTIPTATTPPAPPAATPPAMSPESHSLPSPPVVSPPSPVAHPPSPSTSPPAAAPPPLPLPPPPPSPELPTPPPVASSPPTSTPLPPQPPIPTPPPPPLSSTTESPPLPAPPIPPRASPLPPATPKPTPRPPAKPSTDPPQPPPALPPQPQALPKPAISPPAPAIITPPHKSEASPPPDSGHTPSQPTSSPAAITSPAPPQSHPTTSSSPSPSSPNGSLPTALEVEKQPQPNSSTGLIFGCIVGGVFLLLLLLLLGLLCICHRRCRNRKKKKLKQDSFDGVLHQRVIPISPCVGIDVGSGSTNSGSITNGVPNPHRRANNGGVAMGSQRGTFAYEQLVEATNGFSEANILGQGGFGYVHKGVLPGGKQVAVKRLRSGSQQGEREFQAEVDIISRVHHKHLVSLIGYCITGAERLLVYEFVPNNTLEFHLHGKEQHVMEWATRLKIAMGSAKGLAYLHEDCNPKIIHRDIKAANILLDFWFEAKVSDFGLAKSFSDANTRISHISTQVVGTFGYLAPEYALSGKVTEKSDVYSYGVVLLELITGRPPIQTTNSARNESLVEWARPLLNGAIYEVDFDGLVDPKLHQNYNTEEMSRMVACAAACVRHSAWLRPRMSQIVHALEGQASLSDLQQTSSILYSSSASTECNNASYSMLSDQAYGITGYSDSTSDYGLNPSISSSEAHQTI